MRSALASVGRAIWPAIVVAAYLWAVWSISACTPLLSPAGAGPSSAGLGPDSVSVTESASTLPERMEAAVNEVWGWYSALKTKVDPAVEPMRKLYVAGQELVIAVQGKEWVKALGLATTAWALVDEIKGMVK